MPAEPGTIAAQREHVPALPPTAVGGGVVGVQLLEAGPARGRGEVLTQALAELARRGSNAKRASRRKKRGSAAFKKDSDASKKLRAAFATLDVDHDEDYRY